MNYYYTDPSTGVNEVLGPLPLDEITRIYIESGISKKALVCPEGSEEWISLLDFLSNTVRSGVSVESSPHVSQLTSCPACGKSVSRQAPSCPSCGQPICEQPIKQVVQQQIPTYNGKVEVRNTRAGGSLEGGGFLIILLGMGLCLASFGLGLSLITIGFVVFILGRLR